MNLDLGMGGEGDPEQQARGATDCQRERQGGGREQGIAEIGMQSGLGAAAAQVGLGGEARAKRSDRGAGQVAPEAHSPAGGGGIVWRGNMAVMDEAVAGGVMADQHPRIDEDAEADMTPGGAVDQLMCGGVGDLAQPEAGGEKEGGFLRERQVGAGGPENRQRRQDEGDEAEEQEEAVGGGKFRALIRGRVHEGEDLVEQDRQQAHVEECRPEPWAARSDTEGEERDGREGGRSEGGHRKGRTGGGVTHHWGKIAGAWACVTGAGLVVIVAAAEVLNGYFAKVKWQGLKGSLWRAVRSGLPLRCGRD